MLPVGEENLLVDETETEEELITSRTYRLDENGRMAERIDGLEAIKQSLSLILRTERGDFEIYGSDYGVELTELIGQPVPLVYVSIEDAIKDALMQDDRVEDVSSFDFKRVSKDSVSVTFNVTTIVGRVDMRTEVKVSG